MTAKLTIRIEQSELDKLRALATDEKRSINAQVLYIIRKCLEETK